MTHIKEIVTNKEQLYEWSVEIDTRKEGKLLQEIILSLKNTMRENNLVSLSAPQIGYNKRVFCLRFGENDYRTFINPVIENNTGFQMARESCTSIPGKTFIIPRFGNIKIYFVTPLHKVESATLSGQAAFRFQHALDHLNGMLTEDIGLEIDADFDAASEDERAEILKLYAESLDLRQKELDKELDATEETKNILDASRFINSVKTGETRLESGFGET